MAFEGLKDQLKEQWLDLAAKVQESSAYNTLRERYESQSTSVQRAILVAAVAFAALILLSFPMSYISTSSEYLSQFEENQSLINGLLAAAQSSKAPPPLGAPMSTSQLRDLVTRTLQSTQILPEQVGDMQEMAKDPDGKLAPEIVQQSGLAAQVKDLNLKQILTVANAFQNLGGSTKLMGIDIVQSAKQTHYYDLTVRIVNFGLTPSMAAEEDSGKGGKAPIRRGRKGAGK